jgi:hypothetical protein
VDADGDDVEAVLVPDVGLVWERFAGHRRCRFHRYPFVRNSDLTFFTLQPA